MEKPFSSHEGEEEEEGTLREGDQEKKRKRDEKIDRKHHKDYPKTPKPHFYRETQRKTNDYISYC